MTSNRAHWHLVAGVFGVWIGTSVASGCAFGARHVNLTYPPQLPAAAVRPARYGRVAVAPLTDARSSVEGSGRLLAKVRNGYGMPTASVLANQDPVLWVSEGVARALVNEGFTVVRVPATVRDVPTITGRVTRASGGMYMSTKATVSADLTIANGGEPIATIACHGDAAAVAWTASADEFGGVFEAAMSEFARNCGPQLSRVLVGDSRAE